VSGAAAADTPGAGAPAVGSPAAGTPAPKSSAQIEAGEPRANASPAASAPPPAGAPPPAPAAAAAPAANEASSATAARSKSRDAAPRAAASSARASKGNDRVDLSTATVTGDREQPKVMYIVPWKRSDIGDLSGKPMNSLLDEALAPVDRDEFRREVVYYSAVKATSPENGPAKPAANQGEK
jgi:hypothetical protein